MNHPPCEYNHPHCQKIATINYYLPTVISLKVAEPVLIVEKLFVRKKSSNYESKK